MQVAWNFTFHGCWIAEWYHPISKHCMCPHLDGSYWYLLLASVQRPGDQAPGCCALQGVGILQGETLILRWAAWTFPRCFWRFQGWIDVKRLNRYKLSALNEMHSTDRPSCAIKHLAHTSLHPEPACNLQSPDYMQLLQTAIFSTRWRAQRRRGGVPQLFVCKCPASTKGLAAKSVANVPSVS